MKSPLYKIKYINKISFITLTFLNNNLFGVDKKSSWEKSLPTNDSINSESSLTSHTASDTEFDGSDKLVDFKNHIIEDTIINQQFINNQRITNPNIQDSITEQNIIQDQKIKLSEFIEKKPIKFKYKEESKSMNQTPKKTNKYKRVEIPLKQNIFNFTEQCNSQKTYLLKPWILQPDYIIEQQEYLFKQGYTSLPIEHKTYLFINKIFKHDILFSNDINVSIDIIMKEINNYFHNESTIKNMLQEVFLPLYPNMFNNETQRKIQFLNVINQFRSYFNINSEYIEKEMSLHDFTTGTLKSFVRYILNIAGKYYEIFE